MNKSPYDGANRSVNESILKLTRSMFIQGRNKSASTFERQCIIVESEDPAASLFFAAGALKLVNVKHGQTGASSSR